MSRIGKSPVTIPEGVTIDINDTVITVKGKLGELTQDFSGVTVKEEQGNVLVQRLSESKEDRSKHGLYRS